MHGSENAHNKGIWMLFCVEYKLSFFFAFAIQNGKKNDVIPSIKGYRIIKLIYLCLFGGACALCNVYVNLSLAYNTECTAEGFMPMDLVHNSPYKMKKKAAWQRQPFQALIPFVCFPIALERNSISEIFHNSE